VVDAAGTNAREIVRTSFERDALSWSADGRRIAYASLSERQLDLFAVDVGTGRVDKLFESSDFEWSPSWDRASGALVFCGDPDGLPSAWWLAPERAPERLSAREPADLASAAPSGKFVSWLDLEGRLVVLEMESRRKTIVAEPRQILSAASWSGDERYVAVEAYDWGSSNVYIIDVREGRAMMLTKWITGEGMPSWNPRGDEIACLINRDGEVGLWTLANFSEYLTRLSDASDVNVFDRPAATRVAPRENLRRVRAAPQP
jgi:Tol biopolymer transport system component